MADVSGANLTGANAGSARLEGADLQGATLEISEGNDSRTVSRDGEPVIEISYETPAARTGRTQFKHIERGYVLDIRTAEFTGS